MNRTTIHNDLLTIAVARSRTTEFLCAAAILFFLGFAAAFHI